MAQFGRTPLHCVTCEGTTTHAREQHHSGEYLMRCQRCGTWTLAEPKFKTVTRFPRRMRLNPIKDEVRQAAKLAKDFSGHAPKDIRRVSVANRSNVRVAIGTVTGIMYLARRDSKTEQYLHRFAKGCRPSLVVSPDGKYLELIGGSFRFTDRGIVDTKCRDKRQR